MVPAHVIAFVSLLITLIEKKSKHVLIVGETCANKTGVASCVREILC